MVCDLSHFVFGYVRDMHVLIYEILQKFVCFVIAQLLGVRIF